MADNEKEQQQAKAPAKQPESSGLKKTTVPEEGTIVDLARGLDANGKPKNNYVWVKGTGKSKHFPKGTVHEVHILSADKLVEKGAAERTTAPAKPKAVAKKTKDEDED